MGAFKKSLRFLTGNIPLLALLLGLNYAVLFLTVQPLFNSILELAFEGSFALLNQVPLAQLPFYLYSQYPDTVNSLLLIMAFNALLYSIVNASVVGVVKEKNLVKGLKLGLSRAGSAINLTILTTIIWTLVFAFTWVFLGFASLLPGILSIISTVLVLALFLIVSVELTARLFLAFPVLVFEKKNASDALIKSSAFGKAGFWSVLTTIAFLAVTLTLVGLVQELIISSIADELTFMISSLAFNTLAMVFALTVPAYYYSENKLRA